MRRDINAVFDIVDFLKRSPPNDLKKEPEDIVLADAVQRQGRLRIGEERGAGMFVDRVFVEREAQGILGVEQCVEMAAGDVRLEAAGEFGDGPDFGTAVGHVAVLTVEGQAHAAAAEADGVGDIGGVDVGELGRHGLEIAEHIGL